MFNFNLVCTQNTFGKHCTGTCHCAMNDCDPITGSCMSGGCADGWQGDNCQQGISIIYNVSILK